MFEKLFGSVLVRRALYGLLAAVAGALGWSQFGCKGLTVKQVERLDRFACEARALAPLVEPVLNTSEVLKDLYSGKADVRQLLRSLNATEAETDAFIEALKACDPAQLPENIEAA